MTFPAEREILSRNQKNDMAIRALPYALFISVLDTAHVSCNCTMSKSEKTGAFGTPKKICFICQYCTNHFI